MGSELSCFFRSSYERETQLSAETYDYLTARVFAASSGLELGLRTGNFYRRTDGAVSIETVGPCDQALVRLKTYFDKVAATAPTGAVAAQIGNLNKTWTPIQQSEFEYVSAY